MEIITLIKPVYNKNQYQKVIDTSFTQLIQPQVITSIIAPSISISEFFTNYQTLFFEIPKFGDINSHEYLIKTSQEYAGDFSNNDTIQALLEEITQLRQENLDLQQQLLGSTTLTNTNNQTTSPINGVGGSIVNSINSSGGGY